MTFRFDRAVRRLAFAVSILALVSAMSWAAPSTGEAPLNNDPDGRETYRALASLNPGEIRTVDTDDDGMFDELEFGVQGGGAVYGWSDLDADEREAELVVTDTELASDEVRQADADDDDDPELIWVGIRGADFDGNGDRSAAEAGAIIGIADVDGDSHPEIAVEDASRAIGAFKRGSFGIHADVEKGFEVIWVGILNDGQTGRAAKAIGLGDINDDGEAEIELQDLRTNSPLPFDQPIDIDDDGDGDIVIRIP